MPSRQDLNPGAMRAFTPHIGLVDVRPGEGIVDYVVRRAGAKWEEVYGPITGCNLHDYLPPALEKVWRQMFDSVLERKAPVRVTSRVEFQGKTWLMAEIFIAPLGQEDQVTMLFIAFATNAVPDEPQASPIWSTH